MIQATTGGARIAPTEDPLLKMPEARARSRSGNHSATTFTPAGQFPASPMPSRNREKRSEEHTSELQSQFHLVCRLLLEKKKKKKNKHIHLQKKQSIFLVLYKHINTV